MKRLARFRSCMYSGVEVYLRGTEARCLGRFAPNLIFFASCHLAIDKFDYLICDLYVLFNKSANVINFQVKQIFLPPIITPLPVLAQYASFQ